MRTTLLLLLFLFFCPILLLFAQNKIKTETGAATYYARRFHNKPTASGITYSRDDFVCAHKKHPFGTLLKVRNKANDKIVIVKVIDRGPHAKNRVIDLSYAAARAIDMVRQGVVAVEITEYIRKEPYFKVIKGLQIDTLLTLTSTRNIKQQLKYISEMPAYNHNF